ncbi:MAG: GFA family protein [Halioglobus sp.]
MRFNYAGPSLWCSHCHCSMCQRAHGSALVTWVGVPEKSFSVESVEHLGWHKSSDKAERGFCRQCGSSLFFRSEQWPGEMHIVRTNIDGDIDREPTGHVFWDTHVEWLKFEDDLPKG